MRSRLFVFVVLTAAATACGLGDNSHDVYYRNTTGSTVLVYQTDATKGAARRVAAGETLHEQWIVPPVWSGTRSGAPQLLQASTESGEHIFCHRFSFDELEKLGWVIEITRRNDCT